MSTYDKSLSSELPTLNNISTSAPVAQQDVQTSVLSKPRLFFIDHLRVAMMMRLVVLHLAITYGALAPWYYLDPSYGTNLLAIILLTVFVLLNNAFSMSFFFLISAYFMPASYDRKGPAKFIQDKLLRLGVPLLICSFCINPFLTTFGMNASPVINKAVGPQNAALPFWHFIATGPLWFVFALLIFTFGYVLWRLSTKKASSSSNSQTDMDSPPPTLRAVLLFTLAMAIMTFIVRIWLPIGWTVPYLGLQLGMFPQYISLFIVGLITYRRNWFMTIPNWMGKLGFWSALAATFFLFPIAFLAGTPPQGSTVALFSGGLTWQAALYAIWESITCVGACLALLIFFRQRLNQQGRLGKFLSAHSYSVYLVHTPAIVFLAFALSTLSLNPFLKLLLASCIAIPLCFAAAYLLRKLPYAKRIL